MAQSLGNGKISIMKLDVLTHKGNSHLFALMLYPVNKALPLTQIGLAGLKTQFPADNSRKTLSFKHERGLVENWQSCVLNYAVRLHIAKVCNLGKNRFVCNLLIITQNNDIRGNTHALKFFYAVLGRF